MKRDPKGNSDIRFEATVHAKGKAAASRVVANLDLDRIPDPKGHVRVLLTADDLAPLLEQGVEVRIVQAYPVKPLDPSLIEDDEAAKAKLEEQTRGIKREGRP